jgi:hypothetical protein
MERTVLALLFGGAAMNFSNATRNNAAGIVNPASKARGGRRDLVKRGSPWLASGDVMGGLAENWLARDGHLVNR